MHFTCPECGCEVFMRAVKLVKFRVSLLPWLPPAEEHIGWNAACAAPACGAAVRIDRNGSSRLRVKAPEPPRSAIPAEPERPRPGIEPYVTPGQLWTREAR